LHVLSLISGGTKVQIPYQTVYYMQKACVAAILIFCFGVMNVALAQQARVIRFASHYTSFPDTARANGHKYDTTFYTTAEHYMDSSVILVVPPGFVPGKKVDLVFWFHGWHNNIEAANIYYELAKQLESSGRNAVLVLAETAKNAPDSYGGKLEQQGVFTSLVRDVMEALKQGDIIPKNAASGNIVLAGHSGAYRVIANILQNGGMEVKEVLLFDALYAEIDKYMAWIEKDKHHHFVHWFTNQGGGTDIMSDTMTQQLRDQNISYARINEDAVTPNALKDNRVMFIHSPREHNVIINNPDDFALLLENSFYLTKIK